jgi:hypothetical protein
MDGRSGRVSCANAIALDGGCRKTSPLDIAVMWIEVPDLCIDTDSARMDETSRQQKRPRYDF